MFMVRSLLTLAVLCLGLSLAHADDAKAIIQKAIEAMGYPKDNKPDHQSWDEEGKMSFAGQSLGYKSKWYFEGPDRYRFDMNANMGGQNITLVFVQNGKKAKESMNNQSRPVEGKKLEETTHGCYQLWLLSLKPLVHEQGFKLTALGESKFHGRDVVSVKVQREGRRDVTLHFEKGTHYLAGCSDGALDEFRNWKEVSQETILGDYQKNATGEMKFTTMVVRRDDQVLLQSKFTNSVRSDKLQPELFKVD